MHGQPYAVGLTIGFQGKGIPYGGFGHIREDGGANHGFKLLKGQPRRLDEIPELKQDAAMRELVR